MYCKKCGIYNDEDSVYCKKCGIVINEDLEEKKEKNKSAKKEKVKSKTKVKRNKSKKPKRAKQKNVNKKTYNNKEKGMTFIQKIFMFILFVLVLGLIGALSYVGYQYYTNKDKVEVPNLIGLNYEQAKNRLAEENLEIEKKTIKTENQEENLLVIKQNKKAGKTVVKGTKIKVTIAIYEEIYIVEDFSGMSIDTVKSKLENANINYIIEEEYSNTYTAGFVISQNIKAGSKIKAGKTIKIKLSKGKKETTEEIVSSSETESTQET